MGDKASGSRKSADAANRRAAALRQNLRRRKQQLRSIADDPEGMAKRFDPLPRSRASPAHPATADEREEPASQREPGDGARK